jgi:NAD-dependent SIR2 family protein deacetylase
MTEDQQSDYLSATCTKCEYKWDPYTHNMVVPCKINLKCPKCGDNALHQWYDRETKKKMIQKQLGLLNEPVKMEQNPKTDILEKRLDTIEAKLIAITTEQELLRIKLDLITKDQLQKVNAELSDHNFNINSIHDRVNRIDTQIEHAKKYGKFAPDE